jgi:baculoviral IAP repeat-containing protein 6
VRRLAQEHADLSQSLPLTPSSAVWARVHADRMDCLQMIISGPEDTPYSGGLFLFDVFFPPTYPTTSPKVNLQTTGNSTVRFNPNLYNCGQCRVLRCFHACPAVGGVTLSTEGRP